MPSESVALQPSRVVNLLGLYSGTYEQPIVCFCASAAVAQAMASELASVLREQSWECSCKCRTSTPSVRHRISAAFRTAELQPLVLLSG